MRFDPFQREAIAHIREGVSVLVSAPTGAGKTVIAEHVIRECIRRGRRVVYTAPIKALSNQKYRDFSSGFPDRIGILTGDVSLNPRAPVLIMTTEIFRNKIIEERGSLEDYAWVIFDEIHYLDDFERGSVWEESLMFLPAHMRVLGLSATVPNIDELAQWIASVHGEEVRVVKEEARPVPLHIVFQCQDRFYDRMSALVKEGFRDLGGWAHHRRQRPPKHVVLRPNRVATLMHHLRREDRLPCIYFVFSRKRTEHLAEELSAFDFLTPDEKRTVRGRFEDLCRHFDVTAEAGRRRLAPLIERGIAYHHAGMLPTLKEVVERLFTGRLIKVIVTTETFALGINMPARTVVFDTLRKYSGRGHAPLRTRDFYQMAGRAGRRSIDAEGFVYCRVNPHDVSPRELKRMIHSRPEPVCSRFNASYATLLNLYQKYGEALYEVYPRTFHFFREHRRQRERALEILHAKVALLKTMGCIAPSGGLTEKGAFAARVYGYELLFAELFSRGLLDALSETDLGILCAAVVYEPRKNSRKPRLPRQVKRMERMTDETASSIQRRERRMGIVPVIKRAFFHLSLAMEAWLRGESFDTILRFTDADEGELIRYFRMVIQVLRDIEEAPVSPELRRRMARLARAINRDVVDAERQLRIPPA